MGTPGYAPREQFQGEETTLSDLYALGATMHQLLTGRNPQGVEPLFTYPPIRQLNPQRLRGHGAHRGQGAAERSGQAATRRRAR